MREGEGRAKDVGVMKMSYLVKITLPQEITALLVVLTGSRAAP